MKKKLSKNSGFTLVELLIVVAIIAILIAVSIPVMGNALERSRKATDAANVRAAKGEIMTAYLSGDTISHPDRADTRTKKVEEKSIFAYDAAKGTLVSNDWTQATKDIKGYGKATGNTNNVVLVVIYNGIVYYGWDNPTTHVNEGPLSHINFPNDLNENWWKSSTPDVDD